MKVLFVWSNEKELFQCIEELSLKQGLLKGRRKQIAWKIAAIKCKYTNQVIRNENWKLMKITNWGHKKVIKKIDEKGLQSYGLVKKATENLWIKLVTLKN